MIIFTCMQKATSVFLQALGKPALSMGLSLLRDFVLSVPFTILFALKFGVTGALYSAPAADLISMIAVVFIVKSILKELKEADQQSRAQRIPVKDSSRK